MSAAFPHELCPICECLVETFSLGEAAYVTIDGANYHPACLVLAGLKEDEGSLVPLEHFDAPDLTSLCPLCEKTIWPDDPTTMVNENECHRICGLDYKVSEQTLQLSELRKKVSELSYRVAV